MNHLVSTAAIAIGALAIIGCGAAPIDDATPTLPAVVSHADENDPATWVKRLDDPATRAQAVTRIVQFFEDYMTMDKGDRNGPKVKPLLDTIVAPATERCVKGETDPRTTQRLVKFLADTRDPRAEACYIKVLEAYEPDSTEDDVRAVCRTVGQMKLKSAAGPLLQVFSKLRASKPKAQTTYRDVYEAMVSLSDPSWEAELVARLGHAIDEKDHAATTDEMFWQVTSAVILGNLEATRAVKPLIKTLLAPSKAAAHMDAVRALVKIGKPSIDPTVALLEGEDKELVEYSKAEARKAAMGDNNAEKGADAAHVATAALILGTIGRAETREPLLRALGKTDNDVARTVIARELTKIPKSPAVIAAFQRTVEKLPITLSLPNARGSAREVLLEKVAEFYDPGILPWVRKTVKEMKGDADDIGPIRETAYGATLKIVKHDQLRILDELGALKSGKQAVAKGFERETKQAKELLASCGDKVDCYLARLEQPVTDATQFGGIKAAYMVGVLGDAGAAKKIVDILPRMSHPAVRFASVMAADSLLPAGDAAIAAALQKMVDEAIEKRDPEKMRLNGPLKTFIHRLNARGQ